MSYQINQHFYPSTQVYLNSSHADAYGGDPLTRSWCYFLFKEPVVNLPEAYEILISVNSAEMPCSFFVITALNRYFTFMVGSTTYTIMLDEGNYSAYEMAEDLRDANIVNRPSDLPFTFTTFYDDIDNRFDFKFASSTLPSGTQIKLTPTMKNVCFGLSGATLSTTFAQGGVITSDLGVDLAGTRVLFIKILNLTTPAYDSRTGQSGNILGRIPITEEPYGIIY
jgi:hypothetical protein